MPSEDAFVGRSGELAVLDQELARVRAGQPRLVWLTGEAGIGKTSLLHRFVDRLSGVRLLWGSGDEDEAELPYGVLSQLVAGLPPGPGRPARSDDLRPDADPLAVGAALLAEFGALQSSGPIVLVVDDAHWADDRSVQALIFVLRRLRNDQVLVLLSARSESPTAAESWDRALAQSQLTRRLPLGGLSAEDLRRLSPAVDGLQLSPAASHRLHEHTSGHPLYARALLQELPPDALLETTGVLPAPHSLASLVLVRLAKVSDGAQTLVLAVAVLGSRCGLSDAVLVAEVGDPMAALDEAVRAGLLVEGPAGHPRDVAFPHLLYRGAVYADLSPARRHALHRRAAEVLGGAASLAHRVAAAVGPDAALADELESLGRREFDEQSWRAAADHLSAAADLSPSAGQKGVRLVAASAAMLAGGDIARAVRFEPLVRAAPKSTARSRVLGQIAVLTGRFGSARTELSVAAELAKGAAVDTAEQAGIPAYLGVVSLIEGDVEQAVEHASEALGADPPADVAPFAGFVLILGLAAQGRAEEARSLLDYLAGVRTDSASSAQRAGLGGLLSLWSDQESDAGAVLADVIRRSPPSMPMPARILMLTGLAEALYRLGDWDGALTHAELALSLALDAGVQLGNGVIHAVASFVSASRGSWDVASARLDVATRSAESLPWWASRAYAATAAATLALARGDHAAIREALRPFDDPRIRPLVDGLRSLAWRSLLVEALIGLGELDEADAALRDLEERTAGRPPGWSALEAARLRAWLTEARADAFTNGASARLAYERALALSEQVQAALSRARLETAYGRFLLSQGERRPALDALRAAREGLIRLQAKPYLSICDELLHTAGLRPPAPGAPLDLTSQELAVARLVAAGRTNSEAGLELFITSRTVAFHLTNIYAKAGINSRRELADRLPQLLS